MIETNYIPQENAQELLDLLYRAKELHSNVIFKVYDTESHVINTRKPEKVIESIDGGDEEVCVLFYDKENDLQLGGLGVLPYEEDGVGFDHSNNDFMKRVMNEKS